jgi:cellobiose phosphorylase
MAAWRREKTHTSGGRAFLFRSSASRRAQSFTARSYSSGRFMHPLRDGEGFSILYRRHEADEEITGTLTAIEGDEQEDGPEGDDGGD